MSAGYKIAESVLVVIHAGPAHVLVMRRTDMGTWQSVTGSKAHPDEAFADTAAREVKEETGLDVHAPGAVLSDCAWENHYPIYPSFVHRYAPGTTHNSERVFALRLVQVPKVVLNPREHTDYRWLPWVQACEQVYSPSNAWAIARLFDAEARA